MPIGKLIKIGVWEDGRFVGSIIFGHGAGDGLHKQFQVGIFELCELVRVALTIHHTPTTRLIAIALRMLKGRCPGLKLVASYADPYYGHVGTLYQAGNWLYLGESSPGLYYEDLASHRLVHNRDLQGPRGFGGRTMNHEAVQAFYTKRKNDLLKAGLIRKVVRPRKHQYVMPFDDGLRRQLSLRAKPYPKGVRSQESVALPDQGREGGASPTRTLQVM